MQPNEFLIQENYMLRREIEKLMDKNLVYEDIIFRMLDVNIKFELSDEISDDPLIFLHINIPETNITIKRPLKNIKGIMMEALK